MSSSHLLVLLVLVTTSLACERFPNNTETVMNFWQCDDNPMKFYNATPQNMTGDYEYPVHLSTALIVKVLSDVPFTSRAVREDDRIWAWNNCEWVEIPTLGMLSNMDGCGGIACPIRQGAQQWLRVEMDFDEFTGVINLLKDDSAYQFEYRLTDIDTGNVAMCFRLQARIFLQ